MSRSRLGMGVLLLFLVPVWNLLITGGEASNRPAFGGMGSSYPRSDEIVSAAPKLVRVSYLSARPFREWGALPAAQQLCGPATIVEPVNSLSGPAMA